MMVVVEVDVMRIEREMSVSNTCVDNRRVN